MTVTGKRRLLAVLAVVALGVWIAPWGGGEEGVQEAVDAREASSLRAAIYLQAKQIEAYRRENGTLPDSLPQVGDPLPGIDYMKISNRTYMLTGATDGASLTYSSDESLEEFLGDAEGLLSTGG